ncbi:hypothetical protein EGW08_008582, partial [Elysia chlorotica]
LYETNFTMAMVYIVLMVTALVIGTAGNLLILVASACLKSLRKTGYIFIINLAAADLCVAGIADPMCVVAVLKGEAWFNDKAWLCETVAAMCLTACFCAFLSLTLASMNRYVFVCHNMVYDRIFTKKACVVMCVSVWILAFFLEFPNFIGVGAHTFDKKSHQCIWDRTASFAYTLVVSVVLIGGPLLTMGVCYLLIFKKIYSTKFNLYQINTEDPSRMKKIWSETVKSCRMLFVIFLIFVALWTPYAVVIALDVKDTMPTALHLFVTMLAHLHSSVNCGIYMICNRNFRMAIWRLVTCRSQDKPISSISDSKTGGQKICNSSGLSSSTFATASSKVVTPVSSNEGD